MSPELVTFAGIERALQERAEDGRLDVAPILEGGSFDEIKLGAIDGQRGVIGEEAAVETKQLFAEDDGDAWAGAGIEFAEELFEQFFEAAAIIGNRFEQLGESVVREQ